MPFLLRPIKYRFFLNGEIYYLELRNFQENLWAITDKFKQVLNRDFEWEYELNPSSRTSEFIVRTRFSFKDAEKIIDLFIKRNEK